MLDTAISHQALQWCAAGHGVAVAVVVATWGSAPRPVGARLFVRDDGEFLGSVSGGCIEGAVITAAAEVIASGKQQRLSFGVADETAWEVGLSCGGEISLLVYALNNNTADCLHTALTQLDKRQASVLFTSTKDGGQCLQNAAGDTLAGDSVAATLLRAADYLMPPLPPTENNAVFIEPIAPPPRLLIIGATHITQFLLPMAQQLDFQCVVIDPRQRWASNERFPDATLRHAWPDEALATLGVSPHDAVITLTHDPKIDDPALTAALTAAPSATPFYIGALGSRRTHEKRKERLAEAGVNAGNIHAPIGLDVGAKTAAEIALSIMAEVLGVYRSGATRQ